MIVGLSRGQVGDGDDGRPVAFSSDAVTAQAFLNLAEQVVEKVELRNKTMEATKKVEIVR